MKTPNDPPTNPSRQKSLEVMDPALINRAGLVRSLGSGTSGSGGSLKGLKERYSQSMPTRPASQAGNSTPEVYGSDLTDRNTPQLASANQERASVSNDNNILLDPDILTDQVTQVLVLTVLATLVKYTTDENEVKILYEYLAEASVVFPKVR